MASVSIVLPTYNRGEVVGRAIRSILKQTYPNLELIVVDGGSTDGTAELVTSLSDPRIIYIRNTKKEGVSRARNKGLECSKGEYVSFIDSDDVWLPSKLKMEVNCLRNLDNSYGVVYCSGTLVQNDKQKRISYRELGSGDLSNMILRRWPRLESALIRSECFHKAGSFDPEIECGEDIDFWIRLSQHYKFYYINYPLVLVHKVDRSLSEDWASDLHGRRMRLKKYRKIYLDNPLSLSQEYMYIGLCYASIGKIIKCREYLNEAIRTNSFALRCYIAYFLSFLGVDVLKQAMKMAESVKWRTSTFSL